jgi:predicted phosphodiesterase
MMKRRDFLNVGALASVGAIDSSLGLSSIRRESPSLCEKVKFCVFADIHYRPGRFPNSTKDWLDRILTRAKQENCDFVIHCGDMCHNPPKAKDYIAHYNNFELPTYHVLGNHETDECTYDDVLKVFNIEKGYYFFDCKGFRFIVADTNYYYRKSSKEYVHFGSDVVKMSGDEWGCIPDEQYKWIENIIDESAHPCVVLSHLSFERGIGSKRMQEIFARANTKKPGKVRMAINGHFHCDFLRILEDVVYFDLNSASYQWIGGKRAHKLYPDSYLKKVGIVDTSRKVSWVAYNDPLCAIVTLSLNGELRIDGMKSSFACGITPDRVKMRVDNHSRAVTSSIQSANMKFYYR